MDNPDRIHVPHYLDGEELVRRINVLKQDADGDLYKLYKPLLNEAVDKGVPIFTIDALLKGLGFDNTHKLWHDDLVAKEQARQRSAEDDYSPPSPRM